jgi:DNA/RNA endonuclease G (NUC1)
MFRMFSAGARRAWIAAALTFFAAGCADNPSATAPRPEPAPAPTGTVTDARMECSVTVASGEVRCESPDGGAAQGPSRTVYGGQNSLVRLTSANAGVEGGVFEVDVSVTNLLATQAIGTQDGVTPHANGIRVFLSSGPEVTTGTGDVSVANEDGEGFISAPAQEYFQYAGPIAPNATSPSKPWRFTLAGDVQRFSFVVLISTEVQANLVISELMANPAGAIQDSVGEYVEVYNAGVFPVNLRGFYMRDNGTAADTVKSDVIVPASGYAVLARSTDPAKNGGIAAHYAYTGRIGTTSTNLTFSNSGADRFVIRSPAGVLLDSVSYSSSGVVAKSGVARELLSLTGDNTLVDGAGWTDATNVYDATNSNKGTPGTSTSGGGGTPTPVGPVATVSVTPGNATMAVGDTRQYTATGRDGSGQVASTTFTWSSSNEAVATVSASGLVTAVANGSASIRATSANGVLGSTPVTVSTTPTSSVYRNHVEFGTPADADASNDILLTKTTFALSYNSARGGPNWVSWNLNASHFGPANRCDCFSADPTLPAGASVVVTSDYTGSGYSRGHMVMSEQRTQTNGENASTFLMTNILPQLQDMNGGPWLKFEVYTNDLARVDGKEVYNIAGGLYGASPATLNGAGKVAIPTHTWKIIVVMNGGQGLADVTSAGSIQVIAVSMPNAAGIQSNDWPMYRTTVDALEAATGYDFLAALPDSIEAAVEAAP